MYVRVKAGLTGRCYPEFRFTPEWYASTSTVPSPMLDVARAIQFIRLHADEYSVDPLQIAVMGSSAGGDIAFWLGFHDDLQDPLNVDPVLQQSTQVNCIAPWKGHPPLDPREISTFCEEFILIPEYLEFFGIRSEQFDVDNIQPQYIPLFNETSLLQHISLDDPPVFMCYLQTLDMPVIHNPCFGIYAEQHLDQYDIPSTLLYPDLPEWQGIDDAYLRMIEFFKKYLFPDNVVSILDPEISINTDVVSFNAVSDAFGIFNENRSLKNTGSEGSVLNWKAAVNADWLSVIPDSGALTIEDDPALLVLSASVADLPEGVYVYTGQVTIMDLNSSEQKVIPVTLAVSPPPPDLESDNLVVAAGEVKILGGKQGYVNPGMNEQMSIYFTAAGPGTVHATIYSMRGRIVRKLAVDGNSGVIIWDCRNDAGSMVSSGIYIVHVEGPGIDRIKKGAVIR